MNQPMMPPPLPGYPQAPGAGGYPMPAPQAQPQGYPGPAVAPPPAPTAQPAAPAPYPAYAQQPPTAPQQPQQPQQPPYAYQPAPAPVQAPAQAYAYNPGASAVVGDIGAAIAAATGGDRAPRFGNGSYLLELVDTIVTQHPVTRMLTFKARFRVLESNNPNFGAGAEGAYIEGVAYGAGRIQDCLVALSGYPSKAEYDKALASVGRNPEVELRLLGDACGNPTNQKDGNHYPPNPLAGRRVRTVVSEYDKIAGPQSKKAGQSVHVVNHVWSPA